MSSNGEIRSGMVLPFPCQRSSAESRCFRHRPVGIGRLIVEELEKKALTEKLTVLDLGASLISRQFWESMGFVVQKEDYVPVRNDQKLYYFWMVKEI